MTVMRRSEPPSEPPGPGGYWTRARVIFLGASALFAALVLLWSREVLLPFILAVIIAYVLTPAVVFCERRRVPRSVAILLVYAITGSILYFSAAAMAPRIYAEALQLSRETPALAHKLATKWAPAVESRVHDFLGRRQRAESVSEPKPAVEVRTLEDGSLAIRLPAGVDVIRDGPDKWRVRGREEVSGALTGRALLNDGIDQTVEYLKRNALELIRVGQAILTRVMRGVFLTFMTLMVAGYLMHTREDIIRFFRSLPPPGSQRSFDQLMRRVDRGLSGVVRGQLVICGVNGVLSAIGFALFGLKYWPILALIAGVMSLIPIFGSILSTIPAVFIGLTQDFWTALWVLLWILAIHQIEANLLNPKIIGVAAKLHPVLVVFALIAGEHSYGLWGALLAVPALSIAQSLFNHFRFESMPDAVPDSVMIEPRSTMPPPSHPPPTRR
jgi:predicted PurR-regulated permease PerM